jgi:hypothetical protein
VASTLHIPWFSSRIPQITVAESSAVAGDADFSRFHSRFYSPFPPIRFAISPSSIDSSLRSYVHTVSLKNNEPIWMVSSFYRRHFKKYRPGNITRRSKHMRSIQMVVFAGPTVPVRGGPV